MTSSWINEKILIILRVFDLIALHRRVFAAYGTDCIINVVVIKVTLRYINYYHLLSVFVFINCGIWRDPFTTQVEFHCIFILLEAFQRCYSRKQTTIVGFSIIIMRGRTWYAPCTFFFQVEVVISRLFFIIM